MKQRIKIKNLRIYQSKFKIRTTLSHISVLAAMIPCPFVALGWTLFVKNTIIKSLSLSAHIIVPVKPVCPKEFGENKCPQGGCSWIGTVSHPKALLF